MVKGSEALGFTSCLCAACVVAAETKIGVEKRSSADRELKVYIV